MKLEINLQAQISKNEDLVVVLNSFLHKNMWQSSHNATISISENNGENI